MFSFFLWILCSILCLLWVWIWDLFSRFFLVVIWISNFSSFFFYWSSWSCFWVFFFFFLSGIEELFLALYVFVLSFLYWRCVFDLRLFALLNFWNRLGGFYYIYLKMCCNLFKIVSVYFKLKIIFNVCIFNILRYIFN